MVALTIIATLLCIAVLFTAIYREENMKAEILSLRAAIVEDKKLIAEFKRDAATYENLIAGLDAEVDVQAETLRIAGEFLREKQEIIDMLAEAEVANLYPEEVNE